MVKIDDTYGSFLETVQQRFPGYRLGADQIISNVSDVTINLDELMGLLRSKDIARYH